MYRTEEDPGLHAAAEWLLRTWKQEAWLKQVNEDGRRTRSSGTSGSRGFRKLLTKDKEKTPPQWYVNSQGQTMVVIPGPVEFVMGSPPTEEGRQAVSDAAQEADRSVVCPCGQVGDGGANTGGLTKDRYLHEKRYAPEPECPVVGTSWYQAAAYCNWLSKEEGSWRSVTRSRGRPR